MSLQSILCPIDFSACSDEALIHASTLASQGNAKLFLLHVSQLPVPYNDGIPVYSPHAEQVAQEEAMLKTITPPDEKVDFERHHRIGEPAVEILNFAQDHHVDLIVMGTHGRKGLSRMLMGSVAEKVVRKAGCPVLTYRVAGQVPEATSH